VYKDGGNDLISCSLSLYIIWKAYETRSLSILLVRNEDLYILLVRNEDLYILLVQNEEFIHPMEGSFRKIRIGCLPCLLYSDCCTKNDTNTDRMLALFANVYFRASQKGSKPVSCRYMIKPANRASIQDTLSDRRS
jgi:hypothetical protein